MTPSLNQRLAELRIQDLHAEAAHARLVKEARAARREHRGPSRFSKIAAAFRPSASEERPVAVRAQRIPARRTAAKSVPC
ncbi:MAG: hypothetical protein ACRDJ1_08995 [Actinomycetota bacterium]